MAETTIDRFLAASAPAMEMGWALEALTAPSALFVANGLRFGPDGDLYVAQAFGSRISAINPATRSVHTVYDGDGPASAPDDLAFDAGGNMYVTDVMGGQVCVMRPNGTMEILRGDLHCANGITMHQDRIFVDECYHEGRLVELSRSGELVKVLAEHLPAPNALALGPDMHFYFPVIGENAIWRVPLQGGQPEVFATDLGMPLAVKFTTKGELITVQGRSGEVLKLDIRSGTRTRLATLRPGLDNLEITADDRIFVSHFIDGGVAEITADGTELPLCRPGLVGPYGMDFAADGTLWAADGISIIAKQAGQPSRRAGHIMDGAFPGWVNSVACLPDGTLAVSTSAGGIVSYHPDSHVQSMLAQGLDQPTDLAVAGDGTVYTVEAGAGTIIAVARGGAKQIAKGLARPAGVAAYGDICFVSDAEAGKVYRIDGGAKLVVGGLTQPEGMAVIGEELFILDAGARQLVVLDLARGESRIVATNLPVGSPRGGRPRVLPGLPGILPGPLRPFAGLAAGPDKTLYIGANGSGALLALRRA